MPTFMMLVTGFISVLLIAVILLQRGRGGGLVGALSGLGGQSAFGTKAGDMFTRITIGIAAAWVIMLGLSGQVLRAKTGKYQGDEPAGIQSKSTDTGSKKKLSGAGATPTSSAESDDSDGLKKPIQADEPSKSEEGDAKKEENSSVKPETDSKPSTKSDDQPKSDEKSKDAKDGGKSEKEDGTKSEASDKATESK